MLMTRMFNRRWVRCLGLAGVAVGGYLAGQLTERVAAQPPGAPLPPPDKRVVAFIYGNLPITREELGDFLINRGGSEKLELLVNKRIIEIEAAKRKITVTPIEINAALNNDITGMDITLKDFIQHVLPRYKKTIYEWTEDVIKPRLMLTKMCQDQVRITEDEIKRAFENKYGERRQPKIIIWKADDNRAAQRQWDEARKSEADFDRIARSQFTASLAATAGLIAPIGRYPDVQDETCTKKLNELKMGEMTELFGTPAGIMCMKLVSIVPAEAPFCKVSDQSLAAMKAANVPDAMLAKIAQLKDKEFSRVEMEAQLGKVLAAEEVKQVKDLVIFHSGDMAVSYARLHGKFEREVFDKKISVLIPEFYKKLKADAHPDLLLKSDPTPVEIREAVEKELKEMGLPQGGANPTPQPKQ